MSDDPSTSRPPKTPRALLHTGLVAGAFAMVFVGACATIETLVMRVPLDNSLNVARAVLRAAAAGFVLGFVPAAVLSSACVWLGQKRFGARVEELLFWLPTALALLAAIALRGSEEAFELDGTLLSLVAGAVLLGWATRRLPALEHRKSFWFFPIGLAWLGSAFVLLGMMRGVDGSLPAVAQLVPLALGLATPGAFITHGLLSRWWPTTAAAKKTLGASIALVISVGTALGGVFALFSWIPGLYLPLKVWVAASLPIGLWLVFEPLFEALGARGRVPVVVAQAGVVTGLIAAGWMLINPVATRFGPLPAKSIIGVSVQVLSAPDDADGDGFYAVDAGGNDCDDADATITPASWRDNKHCWAPTAEPAPDEPTPAGVPEAEHVVLVMVDAARADILYADDARERFPNFHELASRSVVFERAYAPGNSTTQSIVATLTGTSPVNLLTSMVEGAPWAPDELMRTHSVFALGGDGVCRAMLAYTHGMAEWPIDTTNAPLNFAVEEPGHAPSGHSSPLAAEGLRAALEVCGDRRSMLVMYLDDPHRDADTGGYRCRDGSVGEKQCYLEELEVVDDALGDIVGALADNEMLDSTLLTITADHGEAFGEHAYASDHSSSVFDEQVRVPLIVSGPGLEPSRVDTPVSLLGFKATAADAANVPLGQKPPYPSWLPVATGAASAYPPPISENWLGHFKRVWASPTSAAVFGRHKVIYDWKTTYLRIYDLQQDPHERHNLAATDSEFARKLLERFKARHARLLTHPSP